MEVYLHCDAEFQIQSKQITAFHQQQWNAIDFLFAENLSIIWKICRKIIGNIVATPFDLIRNDGAEINGNI